MWILFVVNLASGTVATEHFKDVDACIDAGLSLTEIMPETYKTACQPAKYKAPAKAKKRK
mgnify:CR=1 FL=1